MIYNLDNRLDIKLIIDMIEPNSRVLDVGCGDGELLYELKKKKNIKGTGIEICDEQITNCVSKGLSVVQLDINEGLKDYEDKSFDYVILSQTLQVVEKVDQLVSDVLRVGKKAVVSFPNFGYWQCWFSLLFWGRAPITRDLPHLWYQTPNSRVLTLKDFRTYCKIKDINIIKEIPFSINSKEKGEIKRFLPNMRAHYGIYLISR